VNGLPANDATLIVSIAEAATPSATRIVISPSASISRIVGQPGTSTLTLAASSGTLDIQELDSDRSTPGNTLLVRNWNGLTVTAPDNAVTVTGTPLNTGSERFTLSGEINGKEVTGTVTVTSTSSAGAYFQSPAAWSKQVAGANSVYVNLPVTEEFVTRFGSNGDGVVTDKEISYVSAHVSSGNVDNYKVESFKMVNGATGYGTLQVLMSFTPKAGAPAKWYENISLDLITVTGANGQTASTSLGSGGLTLGQIKDARPTGGGSGCDAGLGFLGLTLAAPFILRGKK
jgi:hypothetical protein